MAELSTRGCKSHACEKAEGNKWTLKIRTKMFLKSKGKKKVKGLFKFPNFTDQTAKPGS